jgi:hypothetical protein
MSVVGWNEISADAAGAIVERSTVNKQRLSSASTSQARSEMNLFAARERARSDFRRYIRHLLVPGSVSIASTVNRLTAG